MRKAHMAFYHNPEVTSRNQNQNQKHEFILMSAWILLHFWSVTLPSFWLLLFFIGILNFFLKKTTPTLMTYWTNMDGNAGKKAWIMTIPGSSQHITLSRLTENKNSTATMHISRPDSSLAHQSVILWLFSRSAASHYLLQTPLIFVTLKSQGPHNVCTACFISAELSLPLQAEHRDVIYANKERKKERERDNLYTSKRISENWKSIINWLLQLSCWWEF